MTAAPAPDVTYRTDATDEEFAARIAGYPADVAHAAMVEQVARAIFAADDFPGPSWEDDVEGNREDYRCLAAAAIAAMPANPAAEALRRVEALAEELRWKGDLRPWQEGGGPDPYEAGLDDASERITAALAPQPADAEGTGR